MSNDVQKEKKKKGEEKGRKKTMTGRIRLFQAMYNVRGYEIDQFVATFWYCYGLFKRYRC